MRTLTSILAAFCLLAFLNAADAAEPRIDDRDDDVIINEYFGELEKEALADPTSAAVIQKAEVFLEKMGQPRRIGHFLGTLLNKNPEHLPALFALSEELLDQGRANAAMPYVQQLLKLKPDDLTTRRNAARAYVRLGREREALPHLEAVAAADPTDSEARNAYAVALARSGNLDAAIAEFNAIIALNPNDAVARNNLIHAQKLKANPPPLKHPPRDHKKPQANDPSAPGERGNEDGR